ncbi:MAG: DNA repair protein RadC [Marinisporobacter sp.]|jgi:DNA repair protein RadC|nr:DNA repair protein RadC [Marinisporobacter sp.]
MERTLIRERVEKYGVYSLMDWEVVSLITSIKVEVLNQFKNFDELYNKINLLEVTNLQRQKIRGLFEVAFRINAKSDKRIKITSPTDVANLYMSEMKYLKKEEFRVVLLNTKNEVIDTKTISIGTLNSSLVSPREVFKESILESSNSIILLHNHPSGNSSPSKEDVSTTKRLVEAGEIIGIEVLDHIIIGDGQYISLKEMNII